MTTFDPRETDTCWRCKHPYAWHQPLDLSDVDPLDLGKVKFRCWGHEPGDGGMRRGCLPDCPEHDPHWLLPLAAREPTQAEKDIARKWVDRQMWAHSDEAEAAYDRALSVLVFANARPTRKAAA